MASALSSTAPSAWRWLARYHGWLVAALWVGTQVACWLRYPGTTLNGDATGYYNYARQIATTQSFAEGYYLRYVGYATFLSVWLKLGLGLAGIRLVQVALMGLALLAFYRTAWQLSRQHWPTAALAAAALAGWFEVQAFSAFFLTEVLFTSLLIFSLWALVRARGPGGVAWAALLLLLTMLVRPNGFIAPAAGLAAGLCWLWQASWPGRTRWVGLLLLAWVPLAWQQLNWLVGALGLLEHCAAGTVICNYLPASLPPPASLQLPNPNAPLLAQLLWFIAHNFHYFGQLASLRLAYFLGFPKPWHSPLHVAWLAATLPALYWLAARGVGSRAAALPIRTYLAACLLLQMGSVMLTFEDWDVRFSGPMIPYWLLLAALGAQPELRRLEHQLDGQARGAATRIPGVKRN